MKFISQIFLLCLIIFSANSQPSIIWNKTYDGGFNQDDECFDFCKTSDGNYVLAGQTSIYGATFIKIDNSGEVIWKKNYRVSPFCITNTEDGGSIAADAGFLKMNINGDSLWYKDYNIYGAYYLYDIINSIDKGFVSCGSTAAVSDSGFIIKTDSIGNLCWKYTFGDPTRRIKIKTIVETSSNYFIAAGAIMSISENIKIIVLKLNSNGEKIWQNEYSIDSMGGYGIRIINIEPTFIVVSKNGFIKIDSNGNILDSKLFHLEQQETISDMNLYKDSTFIVSTNIDFFPHISSKVRIIDYNGNFILSKLINVSDYCIIRNNLPLPNGDIIFTGDIELDNEQIDFYAIRTDSIFNFPPIGILSNSEKKPVVSLLYQNYPNPFNPQTTIKYDIPKEGFVSIEVYDILGKMIYSNSAFRKPGSYSYTFDGSNLASGLYFYKIISGSYVETKKMVLIK